MTKKQFIKINKEISDSLKEEYLEGIYNRITGQKFSTGVDQTEKTYNRIQQGLFTQHLQQTELNKLIAKLQTGDILLKYGRHGKSKAT